MTSLSWNKVKLRIPPLLAVLLLSATVSAANYAWIIIDTRPQPVIDEYVEKIMNLADGMEAHSLAQYPRLIYWASIGPRPMLYQVLAAPLVIFLPRSVDSILLVNALFIVALGYVTYRLGKEMYSSQAGLLAMVLVLAYPIITNLSRVARPHALLPTTVGIAILCILLALERRSVLSAWFVAFAILFAFAAHGYSLYLLAGPVILFLLYSVFFQRNPKLPSSLRTTASWLVVKTQDSFFLRGILPSFSIIVLLISSWVILKWDQYVGLRHVAKEIFEPMYSPWHYELTLPDALSPALFWVFLFGGGLIAVTSVSGVSRNWKAVFGLCALLLIFAGTHFAVGGKSWQTFSGVTPLIAAVSAVGLVSALDAVERAFSRAYIVVFLRRVVLSLVLASAVLVYLIVGWGLPEKGALADMMGVKSNCSARSNFCPDRPMQGNWRMADIVKVLLSDEECHKEGCQVSVISHRPRYFSDEAFNYTQIVEFPEISKIRNDHFYPQRALAFHRIGRGEGARLNWLVSRYSIFLLGGDSVNTDQAGQSQNKPSELVQAVVAYLKNESKREGGLFETIFEGKLPNGEIVYVLKREKEIDEIERRKILDSLPINPPLEGPLRRRGALSE